MNINFIDGINKIKIEKKPISFAWRMSVDLLGIDKKIEKVIALIEDHENLFVTRHKYHNQYHLAEVIWCSAWLGMNEFKNSLTEKSYQNHMLVLFLAANFHDAEHPGRGSKIPYELEKKSAKFFQQWWRNNSLFLENLFNFDACDVEQIVEEMIMNTDFLEGINNANQDHANFKNFEKFGYKVNKLKKILNESDSLLNLLPHFAFNKISLWLEEVGHKKNDVEKWEIINLMLRELGDGYSSDAASSLNLPHLFNEFKNDIGQGIKEKAIQEKWFQSWICEKHSEIYKL